MRGILNNCVEKLEHLLDLGGLRRDIGFLVVSGIALILSLAGVQPLLFDLAWIAIVLCGLPIVLEAFIGLVTAFDIKADVLVSLALIASLVIGEIFAAGEVAFIMQLGALLEELTVARAHAGIEKLVRLTPRTARLLTAEGEQTINAEQVQVGDMLRVLPGETVPVDGIIVSGQTSINQAVMTGESLPVDKGPGDEVSSGTVNQFGAFEMRAEKVGQDSSIQRMIRLVKSADAGKAKIVGIADRWATWIVVIALTAAAITWAVTGEMIRAVTILVVFCPCALVLATPTAIMAAIGNATKHGFLVREGDALELLASVSRVVFDKTGTLTYGRPEVVQVWTEGELKKEELYSLCAAAEQLSEHPLGAAIVACCRRELGAELPRAKNFEMLPGRGVAAMVNGKCVLAGNEQLLKEQGAELLLGTAEAAEEYISRGCTVIYVAVDGRCAGFIALADILRESGAEMVKQLLGLGIRPVLLTGDHDAAARMIAGQLNIQDLWSGCLPQEKLEKIEQYQGNNEKVCMIGDGINDAPALKKADVGIAMGGIGSDIAVEAADIALVNDEIKDLPHLLALSRRMMSTIKINMSLSMALNFVAIVLAMTGVLNPVIGALVHNAGSVLVIINSALLLKWRMSGTWENRA